MFKLLLNITLTFFIFTVYAKNEDLEGQSLYQVKVQTIDQVQVLSEIAERLVLDVWRYPVPGSEGLVLVPQDIQPIFENELFEAGITYNIGVQNIKESVDLEETLLAAAATTRSNRSYPGLPFDRIHRYEAVDQYLVELANLYPNVVSVVSGGISSEGRDIKYLKISTTNFQVYVCLGNCWICPTSFNRDGGWNLPPTWKSCLREAPETCCNVSNYSVNSVYLWAPSTTVDTRKPVIMVMSLLHAREWVTLPPTLYAIEKLVIDVTEQDLVNDIDWIILPIANPDGYEFSHTTNRFWRKNRSVIPGSNCLGIDLNRNFDFNWGLASSNNPCSEVFHGSGPFSEVETRIVSNILREYHYRVEMFIDLHSFGSMILFGFGNGQLPPNALTLNVVAVNMAQSIDAVKWPHKRNYIVGNVVAILYHASGISSDYAQSQDVPLSYTYELPAYRDITGVITGFLVESAFIPQAAFETWEGIKAGARWVVQNTRSKH